MGRPKWLFVFVAMGLAPVTPAEEPSLTADDYALWKDYVAALGDERVQKMRERSEGHSQPLHRVGEPTDIAKAALYLASDDSEWVTGIEIVVDGGFRTGRPWRNQPAWTREPHPIRVYRPADR